MDELIVQSNQKLGTLHRLSRSIQLDVLEDLRLLRNRSIQLKI
jgi:hypothetical protein